MRNGQNNNKRMRNRNNNNNNNNSNNNNRRGQNPMTRVFESNGPDIKIRGTASHVAEKYVQLARDARSLTRLLYGAINLEEAHNIIEAAQANLARHPDEDDEDPRDD